MLGVLTKRLGFVRLFRLIVRLDFEYQESRVVRS